jgi:hypothetical protein
MWSEDNSDNQLLIPIPQSWITNSYSDSTNFIGICYPAIIQLWPWSPGVVVLVGVLGVSLWRHSKQFLTVDVQTEEKIIKNSNSSL